MNQSGLSAHDPIIVGAATIALIEGAARDLKDVNKEILTPGHSPSWGYPQIPDGLALCMGCWRLITASQLGEEQCPGAGRAAGPMIAAIYALRASLVTGFCLLAIASPAHAEGAWVLWERVDSFDARGALVSSATEVGAPYTTSATCIAAIDGLERRWQSPQTVVMRDARTMLAVMFRDKNQTITKSMSFLCAPDTVDPRGPKGTK